MASRCRLIRSAAHHPAAQLMAGRIGHTAVRWRGRQLFALLNVLLGVRIHVRDGGDQAQIGAALLR